MVIGARSFNIGATASNANMKIYSPLDDIINRTHIASTAAGVFVKNAQAFGGAAAGTKVEVEHHKEVEFDESGKVIGATFEGETARCQTVVSDPSSLCLGNLLVANNFYIGARIIELRYHSPARTIIDVVLGFSLDDTPSNLAGLSELPNSHVGDDPVIVEVVKEKRKEPPMWRFIELSFVEWLYAILGSTVGWFDEEENSVDTLSMRLANDATFWRLALMALATLLILTLSAIAQVSGYIALLYFNKNTVREEVMEEDAWRKID
ncbi:hypothetical protein Tco_0674661 [Tanacetum coccineum]